MGFVDFFIRRVVFASVCAIIIVIAGTVVIPGLPIAQYPQIALPQVIVSSSYVGASSAEVESGVTIPLEQQINGVQGMKYITSSSSNDGSSSITITFEASRDIDLAAVDVQNRVNTALARLPIDVRNIGVTITKNSGAFIGAYALFTDDDRYSTLFMSNYEDVYMKDRLKRISGVADVVIFGERRFSMRLWLDPDKLAARTMSPSDVLTALREQNVQVAAGSIGVPPAPDGLTYQISVRAIGRLVEAGQFDEVIVKSLPDGTIVRLKDVGHAELGAESYSQLSRWNGHPAVGMGIQQLPGSNALDVKKKVDAAVKQLAKEFPAGLKYETAFDTTAPVSASIKDVVVTLIEAIVLVIFTIYIFLQTLRSTLIPAITIPVSLVGTFAFVKLFGFSINTLTLFGLTLATGLVVDDAIVVIENITRVMEQQHLSPREAASKGMSEVTSAVIATSLVLVAVFVPVAFFPGTTGKIYQQFSLTIAFSIALSAFNAITLTPALSARLLKAEDHQKKKNFFFRGFDRGFDGLRNGYTAVLKVAIRLRWLTALIFVALLGVTGWLFFHVPQAFIPDEDQGYFIVIVQGPEGTSLEVTSNTMRGVEGMLAQKKEIQGCFSVPGFSLLGSGPNKGAIFCSLIPWEDRKGAGQDAMAIVASLRGPLMGGVGGAIVIPFNRPRHPGRRQRRRLPVRDRGPDERAEDREPRRGDLRHHGRGQPGSAAARRLLRLHRQRPADRPRGGPRQGQGARRHARRGLRHPADLHGLGLRERLRLRHAHLPRVRPGGQAVPRAADRPHELLRALHQRADGAAGRAGEADQHRDGAEHQPLQPVPLDRDPGLTRARSVVRAGAPRDGERSPRRSCRPASPSSGPACRSSSSSRAGRRCTSSRSASSSSSSCSPRSTRASSCR